MRQVEIDLAGERLVLDSDRALFWPARGWLVVADVHFGKAAVLRQSGVAIPRGSTSRDLARLDALIERHAPTRLLVLGDLVHGETPVDAPWVDAVRAWRKRRAALDVVIVAGNHDRWFDATALGIARIDGELLEGVFRFRHDVGQITARRAPRRRRGATFAVSARSSEPYVLGGHLHPGIRFDDRGVGYRLPIFHFGPNAGVLPAFGSMTGLMMVEAKSGERVFAATPGGMLAIPT